ncbi:MAG: tetratricopeptide repeat protein, partial [Candidatus Promineifilaceae bacterium]
ANGWVQPRLVETAVARARALFAQLAEPGWLAACDWQLNALPWTRPNFTQAAAELEQALAALLAAEFDDLVPWCRLSLAYAYMLLGRFADAERETAVAQQTFQYSGNTLGLAQCLYTSASNLRRQTRFEAAKSDFTAALALFQDAGAAVQIAITTFQLGQIHWWSQYDEAAAATLLQAAAQFAAADLPLWQAQCQFGLGQIYQQTGQLAAATAAVQSARETFAQFKLRGLWADSLFDSGWLAYYYGQYQTSLDYFQQAQTLYWEIGAHWQHALILMHEGEVYVQMGLFQRALQRLEDSHSRLQTLGFPQRLAACEIRLARVYLQLNNIARAHTYLDQSVAHYQQAAPSEDYPAVHILRAELLFREGKREEALLFWQKALTAAQQQGDQVQTARAQRLLGQALCAAGRIDEARDYLHTAVSHFAAMGMVMDQAAGQVNLGQHYAQTNQPNAARAAWNTALDLAQGAAPELTWQVYAGLGQLAAASGEAILALAEYRRAVAALGKMRRALWQPAIAGAYLTRPRALLDSAVALAITQAATADALYFIEESKAQTTAYQLAAPVAMRPNLPAQLVDLVSEIRWLQQQVSQNSSSGLWGLAKVKEQHQQFVQKVRQYDAAMSRLERANDSARSPLSADGAFDLAQFRQLALVHHGEKWLALDYYQTDVAISGIWITVDDSYSWSIPITPTIRLALDMGMKAGHGRSLSPRHLAALGRVLLPDFVRERLTPETHLIIAPHRQLHRLPWAALQF